MQKKSKIQEIQIDGIERHIVEFKIVGESTLIVHKFSDKCIGQIQEIQKDKPKKGRLGRNPEQEYQDALYKFKDGKRTGFVATGFKAAMSRAAKQIGLTMTDTRGMFHVLADEGDLIEIHGEHRMRSDMVRVASGGADIRYRPEYPKWWAKVRIEYNKNVISVEKLAALLNTAGFACGIGDWRPEKSNSGTFGRWQIAQ